MEKTELKEYEIIIIGEDGLVIKTISTHAPHGIEIDDKENIYVSNVLDNRLEIYLFVTEVNPEVITAK